MLALPTLACLLLLAPPDAHLATATFDATLSAGCGWGFASLKDRATGREWSLPGEQGRLFALELSRADDPQRQRFTLTSREAATVDTAPLPDGLRLTFTDLGGKGVGAVCTLNAAGADPLLRGRIAVTVPEGLILEAVRFPVVSLPAPANASAVVGSTKGGVLRDVAGAKVGRNFGASQPGSLAGEFGCLYDDAGGVYTGSYDTRGFPKSIAFTRTATGVDMQWYHPCFATGRLDLDQPLVLTTFRGADPATPTDWRDAADLYKQWAVKQPWCAKTLAERRDLPAWLREGPAMVRFNRDWLTNPDRVREWMARYWGTSFPREVPLIVAFWGWEKVATWVTPDYFPAYPNDQAFTKLNADLRAAGGHPFCWPSGYHYTLTYDKRPDGSFAWDDRARFDRDFRAHAVVARDGKTLIGDRSWLRGGQTATLCPGDPFTLDFFADLGRELGKRGSDVFQVDQVVGGGFPPCYATTHQHPPGPGPWMWDVFHEQLKRLDKALRSTQPGGVIGVEEPNERFLQQVGIQDYRDTEAVRQGLEPASVFNYLYHEYVPTFQSNPQTGSRWQAAWCLATGQIPHLVPQRRMGPGPVLDNGGFEEATGEVPSGWDAVRGYNGQNWTGEVRRDTTEHHGGQASLRVRCAEKGQTAQVSQNVPVGKALQVGGTYRARVWLKSSGVPADNAILLGLLTPDLKGVGGAKLPYPAAGDWTQVETTFTVPEAATFLRIMIHLVGPGTVWVDDFVLERRQADGTWTEVQRPAVPEDHALMRRWVELYHGEARPWLALGKMLHPPKLAVELVDLDHRATPAILHNAWQAADGKRAVVLVNWTTVPRTATLTWDGRERSITLQPDEVKLVR